MPVRRGRSGLVQPCSGLPEWPIFLLFCLLVLACTDGWDVIVLRFADDIHPTLSGLVKSQAMEDLAGHAQAFIFRKQCVILAQ
jgi:hypothetical protein